ncbi:hypothetical protein D6853_09510 [Butyrivibrio sp. X503]|uniref:Imm42 family immunity protein n=1 Tax=Butyrivibrio sp. X503 TaxID=2364878 RepID=UPI000EA90536|nr:Imm42 family immunity protein [Butyrivibrio sp. X503]RKM55772.1 hypothetical protein D6853_09510 [Butyrivibrio sp. X503]
MVIGDPYVIAVIFENIREWNDDYNYTNGILAFSMDGILFPGEALNATLSGELRDLSKMLETIPQNDEVFGLEKSVSFAKLYDMIFPEDWWNEDGNPEYNITPMTLQDKKYYIFAVGSGDKVRLLYAKIKYDFEESRHYWDDADIHEWVVEREALNKIANRLKNLTEADLDFSD